MRYEHTFLYREAKGLISGNLVASKQDKDYLANIIQKLYFDLSIEERDEFMGYLNNLPQFDSD